jgi:tetratricopeptide (TPR) repeat protein
MDLLERAAGSSPSDARAYLDAAVRAASDRIWVARNAARLFATHVGDHHAARRVIGELEPLTCLEWRLVAAAYNELGERDDAGTCLERAATNARTPRDLCIVALGYRDAGYEDEARLLLDGAAQLAIHAMDVWIVANCYRDSFGDAGRARAVLANASRDAASVGEILGFTRAFAAHDANHDELADFVERAARRASTVHDWIEVSRAHHLVLLDPPEALLAIDRAAQLSTSPQDERTIAVARGLVQIELLDDERPKLPPSKLLAPGARSFAWDRDANRLLAWLRTRIPRTSIDTLSRPAQFLFNDDLVTLLDVQKSGNVPHPLPAQLDVLREYSRLTTNFEHQLRAFACTLLCIDDAAAAIPDGAEAEMAALVESCLELGPDAVAAGAALFAAMADAYEATQSTTSMGYLVSFAELALALCAAWLDPTDPRLVPLLDGIIVDEAAWPRARLRHSLWRTLAQRVFVHPRLVPFATRF